MKSNQIKVTAINLLGGSIESGWFNDINKGEAYAAAMVGLGYIVKREYR